jgi:hypothetical protein
MLAYCTHRDAGFGWFSGVSRARSYPPRSVPPSHHSAGYAIPIGHSWVYGCVCTFIYLSFLCRSALIRASGTTAHPGAVATVPHGCLALIRAGGTTAHSGGVTTVPHGCPALIRTGDITGHGRQQSPLSSTLDRRATGRGYARRTLALRGAAGSRQKRYG